MKNWKTFLGGLFVAIGVMYGPISEKRFPTVSEITIASGALGLGSSSKDKDVTGAGSMARRVGDGN